MMYIKVYPISVFTVECYLELILSGDTIHIMPDENPLNCTIQEAEERLELVQKELWRMESGYDEPEELKDYDDYQTVVAWAKAQSEFKQKLEQLSNSIKELESYIEEQKNSPVFHAYSHILWVHRGVIKCVRDKHDIECITGYLQNKKGQMVKLNVNHCKHCERFFISYDEYLHYRDLYGPLICNIHLTEYGKLSGTVPRAEDSLLSLIGYNVNQSDGLTDTERQYILSQILQNHIMKKNEIINYLNIFIRVNGAKHNMKFAVSKWKSDLDFVRNFQLETQDIYCLMDLRRYRY